MKTFKNKVVVITGAGSGIGKALAEEFAQKGALLALNDINEANLQEVTQALSTTTQVFSRVFDVGNESAMQEFAEAVYTQYQQVDVVINNAGVVQGGTEFAKMTTEDFHWLMNINFWGVIYGSKSFLPYLREQQESSLVNLSSLFGMIGAPSQTSYNASKFAVRGFSEALFLEEQNNQSGVVVSCVHPGGIKTNILKNGRNISEKAAKKQIKMFRTTASTAAQVIIKGIEKKKSRILVGSDAHVTFQVNKFLRKTVQKATLSLYNKTKIKKK
ncbi:MAG: SDR family NAD(P)-dependent oxidoreductase [Aureispira sp.]